MFTRDRYTEEFAKGNAGGDHAQVNKSPKDVEYAQRAYMAWLSAGKSEAEKECARAQDANSHAELKALARLEGNDTCADCTASRPGWAALPHGVFVCIDCAQLHRGLGRHLSQVKAFNTGTYLWFPAELAVMRAVGNTRSNARFCAVGAPPKPSQDAPAAVKLAYARDKYEARRWYGEPAASVAPMSTASPRSAPPPRPVASRPSVLLDPKRPEVTPCWTPPNLMDAPIERPLDFAPTLAHMPASSANGAPPHQRPFAAKQLGTTDGCSTGYGPLGSVAFFASYGL